MTDRQPVIDRITKIMGDYKLDRKDFERFFEIDQARLSRILNAGLDAPKHLVKRLYDKTLLDRLDVQKKEKQKGVPYYDIDVTATAEMFLGQERETTDTYIMIPGFEDCTGWVNVYGDSMYPAYASGEVIAIKEVKNKEVILWGEAYLIVTDELRTIKKLKKSKEGEQFIDLEPSNPNFQTTTIKRSDVLKLFIIKGKLKRTL